MNYFSILIFLILDHGDMKNILKNKILIICLIIISLGWANFNIFYYGHYHIAEDGSSLFHAHPYHKESNQTTPFPGHTHTKSDLFQLAIIIEILSLFISFFAFIFFVLSRNKRALLFIDFITPQNISYRNISVRGPPLFSFQLS